MARILNEETIAANKRKREAADHGKSTPKKSKLKHKGKPESSVLQTPISTQRQNAEMTAGTPLVPASTKSKKDSKRLARALQKGNAYRGTSDLPVWKVSEPIGGRMLDIDAVLTDDEQHLILAYNASIQVYSSANSLLVRKIAINFPTKTIGHETVVAMRLSPTDPDYVWVASSAGRIWKINWTTGEGAEAYLKIKCDYVSDLEVDAVSLEGQVQDVILVSLSSSGQWHILACDIRGLELKATRPVVQRREVIQHLQFLQGGQVLAASSGKDLILGTLSGLVSSFQQLAYEVFILDCSDEISCMDLRATDRVHLTRQSQIEMGDDAVIEVVVGCARGSIFYYNDIVPQLRRLHASGGHKRPIQPRKLHWHRKAVHAVKWSRDGTLFTLHLYFQANRAGHYIISGGSESVLIQWQLDTGKKDPLPHLAGTIENIVVSARGSSYVIHLDDNSTMILSTAENKPTTYISGVQTLVTPPPPSKDSIVRRVGAKNLRTALSRVPAAVDPQDPTHLLLGVSNSQQINDTGVATAMPLLQTVDITTVQGISKQALARTHPTDVNITPKGFPLTEPRVTHLANSRDGRWLATIDEWQPPARDVENLEGPPAERREVHLKFWMPNKDGSSFELVSRINAPHYTGRSERVFDLAADPTCHRFATIGEDGIVRLWQPVIRQRDGIVVKSQSGRQLEHWACSQSTQLYENEAAVGFQGHALPRSLSRSGAVSFSEDGSTVACAFQNGGGSAIFIIDADSGAVVKSINGLTRGEIQGISVLSSQVVLLSEDLVVHNIVLDELSFGISLRLEAGKSEATPILPQLAVDHASGTFATAVSRCDKHGATTSELAIFSPDQSQPAVVHKFPYPIVSLITSPSSTGYMILDAAAQLWSVSHTTNTSSIGLAQPLANIKLDQVEPAQEDHPISLAVMDPMVTEDEEPSDDEMELDAPDTEADDDVHPVVVAPQKLAELFDAAPAFAMPPVEDMFYQVAKLFSTKNSAGVA